MTVKELYKRFLIKINKNDTNEGIKIPVGVFVLLFNSEVLKWLTEELKKDIDNIDSNLIELFFIPDYKLTDPTGGTGFIDYPEPSNFFQAYGSYSYATRGNCKNVKIFNYEIKPGNVIPVTQDVNSNGDFDYEEARFVMTGNNVRLYVGPDYQVTDSYLVYYRQPKYIDMVGYKHFDGTPSVNIDPELDDHSCEEVISRMALEVARIDADVERVQLDSNRLDKEF